METRRVRSSSFFASSHEFPFLFPCNACSAQLKCELAFSHIFFFFFGLLRLTAANYVTVLMVRSRLLGVDSSWIWRKKLYEKVGLRRKWGCIPAAIYEVSFILCTAGRSAAAPDCSLSWAELDHRWRNEIMSRHTSEVRAVLKAHFFVFTCGSDLFLLFLKQKTKILLLFLCMFPTSWHPDSSLCVLILWGNVLTPVL